jgi:iron complex outermembrane receptor protein
MSLSHKLIPTLLSLTPALIAAQTTSNPTPTPVVELDPVDVTASRVTSPSLTVPDLAAARADLARTPGGTEVIDANRYLTGRASTLADTFFLSPGVFAQSRFGSDEARLSIRGSGLQRTFHGRGIRVLQDGVPVNLADGGFDMQSLEPTAAAYINVWRGGNALAHGGSTLGGAIDYVSRNGRNSPGGLARLELGSFAYLRATIAGGAASESTDAYASFTQQQQDGFRDHAEQNNQRLFTNAAVRISETIETRFYLTAVKTDSELPGSLTKAQLEADPRQANPANITGDQKRDFDLLRLANKTTILAAPDTTLQLVSAWTYKDLDHPIFQVVDQLSNDALLGINFSNTTDVLGRENLLRGGVSFNVGRTDAAQFTNNSGSRGVLRQSDKQRATNLEAHLESQLALGAGFTGALGLAATRSTRENIRLGTFNASGAPIANPAGTTYDRAFEQLSPKLGLRWDDAARDTQVYANVSGSFEPPSFSEGGATGTTVVANRAQTAMTYELGSRGQRSFLRWDASLYHARVEDELLAITLPGNVSGTLNADRTIHQGVELGFAADLLGQAWKTESAPDHRVVLRTAWTYGDFRFDGPTPGVPGSDDNRIAGVPPHLVRGELVWETASGYYVGPTFEWVPQKSYIDHANTLAADPYAMLGFKLGRRLDKGLSWFIEAKNLTDETYVASHGVVLDARVVPAFGDPLANVRQFLPGDGRSLFAGLEYRW